MKREHSINAIKITAAALPITTNRLLHILQTRSIENQTGPSLTIADDTAQKKGAVLSKSDSTTPCKKFKAIIYNR